MSKIEGAIGLTVEAKNCRDAFNIVVREHENSSYQYIHVYRGWGILTHEEFNNPHYIPPQTAKPPVDDEARTQQPAPTVSRQESSLRKNAPQSSVWAKMYRACGFIFLFLGITGTIAIAQENEEAGFQFAVIAIALTLSCFLFAFLIDVLTDMRHYLKQIAEKR